MSSSGEGQNKWGIPYRSGDEVRASFVDFFTARGHTFVPSSPVVPHDDPTLLFINSGMNQFKSLFLGDTRSGLKRAVNSQKCLRVSGKHNDLDEVGRDTYHHTFFEMLGNWSFGDYYKKEALKWSWELLTEVWRLPKNRLFATIFRDDDEALEIWKRETDIDPSRILRFGEKSNFWEMGDVGPCGPCSEIHFDMGDLTTQAQTFSDPVHGVNGTNARYIEIWNNVFMQFERLSSGALTPLKAKHVDTGMGFERICSIVQGTGSNYETDVFRPVIERIAQLTGHLYSPGVDGTPHRVIADHLRALTFAIADGATPGNEGRGYVLRRILRRASRFSQQLDQKEPFIFKLVPILATQMGRAYPELLQRQDYVAQVIEAEETRFMRTLKDGLARFAKVASELKEKQSKTVSGSDAFLLYDTYGFPVDLTGVLAEEQGLSVDHEGFAACMNEQRDRARGSAKFDAGLTADEGWTIFNRSPGSEFVGYKALTATTAVTRFRELGDQIYVCLQTTPFYAESGGQVGDIGLIRGRGVTLKVLDTFKVLDMHIHRCVLLEGLMSSEGLKQVATEVDAEARAATVRNHSATHLLHAALRAVLGPHIQQQGSRVAPEGLRFDFTQPRALTADEVARVETLVNEQIVANLAISVAETSLTEAKADGAMALFGEKYGDRVRAIRMGAFSHELCGGTHAQATGQIGLFRILSEASIAAGIRRIEAETGLLAARHVREQAALLDGLSRSLKAKPDEIGAKVDELNERLKENERELRVFRQAEVVRRTTALMESGQRMADTKVLVTRLDAAHFPRSVHQALLDTLASQLGNGVAVLTHTDQDGLSILAAVGAGARAKVHAGDVIKELATLAGGRGGGRPDKAQAGSKFPEREASVHEAARALLARLLA